MIVDKNEKKLFNKLKFKRVNKIVALEFKDKMDQTGICHQMWARKKQLLKEMYNIDWKTPKELNPNIIFD